jgi:hypothetical protein
MGSKPKQFCAVVQTAVLSLVALAAVGSAVLKPPVVQGAAFIPIVCATCPTRTAVVWSWLNHGSTTELPNDPNCVATPDNPCPHYINNIQHRRYVYGNPYTRDFGFNVAHFDTESGFDYLDYGPAGQTLTRLTGAPTTGWRDFTLNTLNGGTFYFRTDGSITRQGFALTEARVCCNTTENPNVPSIAVGTLATGALMGTNDTVYFKFTPPPTSSTDHSTVVLYSTGGTNDFDLYVRCGSKPTASTYDYVNRSGDSNEMVHIPANACSSDFYVAVYSYAGSGQFRAQVGRHRAKRHISNFAIGTQYFATENELAQYRTLFRNGARMLYGSSEGAIFIESFSLNNNGSCAPFGGCGSQQCLACLKNDTGYRSNSPLCSGESAAGMMNIGKFNCDHECIAHELGHYYMCQPDEYTDVSGNSRSQCGHSNMANPWGSNNNYCTSTNHKKDKDPTVGDTTLNNTWDNAATTSPPVVPFSFSGTPDNFDFQTHDFNNALGTVLGPPP